MYALLGAAIIVAIVLIVLFVKPLDVEDPQFFKDKNETERKPITVNLDDIEPGTYDIGLELENQPVKTIAFKGLNITDSDIELNIEEIEFSESETNIGTLTKLYAIDPTNLEFEYANVTAIATGSALYKCKDWNYSERRCYGEWNKLMDITPGEEYTFILTPEDPGFAEVVGYYGFESGTQSWIFGGGADPDSDRSNIRSNKQDDGSAGGSWSAHLQDDSTASYFEQSFNFTAYDSVNITFDYYPDSIDSGEYVQLLCDATEVWRFTNGDHAQGSWWTTTVEITTSDCTFDNSVTIRWEGNPGLSGNADDLWVDGINITGIRVNSSEVSVSQSSDDAEELISNGGMALTSSDLELTDDTPWHGGNQEVGIRFQNVDIPAGATIDSAYIEFEIDEYETQTTNLVIFGEDADNPPTFSTTAYNITSRTKTSASVAWNSVPAPAVDAKLQTPSLVSIVQEIVDRGGWTVNNSMVFIINGTGRRTVEAFDGESANAPLLKITWTPLDNTAPTHSTPVLNSSLGTNTIDENLTVYNQSTSDADNNTVKNIINWKKNAGSIMVLNMPFEGGSTSSYTKDYSGNGNDGTVNGATWNSTGGYDSKGAYDFDGSSDYINLGSPSSLNFTGNDNFTISTWVRIDGNTNQHRPIVSKGDTQYTLKIYTDNKFETCAYDGGWKCAYSQVALTEGNWYHLVARFENGNVSLWQNGIYQNSNTFTSISSASYDVNIGRDAQNPTRFFNGMIDEVMIYDYALSDEQISALYNNRTDLIVSQETTLGDLWQACITPNDGLEDGTEKCSNNLTIVEIDTTNPVINSINDNPDPVNQGNNITITANVTDNVAVDEVKVEILGTNYSMTGGQGTSTLVNASFETDVEGFVYEDDKYQGTNSPNQEDGVRETNALCDSGNCLNVNLNVNGGIVGGPFSGAWNKNVTLTSTSDVTVSFNYSMYLVENVESGEDITFYYRNLSDNSAVAHSILYGANTTGVALNETGSISYTETLAAGTYSFDAGCHLTAVSAAAENAECWIDNVVITAVSETDIWEAVHNTAGEAGLVSYTIYANDTSNNNATAVTGNYTVNVPAPNVTITTPKNSEEYNTVNLFVRAEVSSTSQSCWYNLNDAGNNTFTCGTEPNITASEGTNILLVYANSTTGGVGSDSVSFTVNSTLPLSISITSPPNGTESTAAKPKLKLLAIDYEYSTINYTVYIYYENETLYAVANTGVLINNTETEITLEPALNYSGVATTYKIRVNATDAGNNTDMAELLYYTLNEPAVELVSPANNYWDGDGNITFEFKAYDGLYDILNCSLYIDDVFQQSNDSIPTNGTIVSFTETGIISGTNKEWKVECINNGSNSGYDTRIFNVDTINPVINSVNDAPDPVEWNNIINITANVTDNFGLADVHLNISGSIYEMINAEGDIYYYEYTANGSIGNYSYYITAIDNVDRSVDSTTSYFYVEDTASPQINSVDTTPNPVVEGGAINISANITDNYGMSHVEIIVEGTNYNMTESGANIWYYVYNTTRQYEYQFINFTITAYDSSNNNATYNGNFTVKPGKVALITWVLPEKGEIEREQGEIMQNEDPNKIEFIENTWDTIYDFAVR